MTFPNFSDYKPRLKYRVCAFALAIASAGAVTGIAVAAVTASPASAQMLTGDVTAALHLRLPKTPITQLNCKGFGGLCEVVSGKTLFYVDRSARYLFVGRLYDVETRADLTAARLLEIDPDMLAANAARSGADSAAGADADNDKPAKAAAQKVKLDGLSAQGAVHWGSLDGPRLIVFSDFQCGYCKRLTGQLASVSVHVEERPISIFGPESRKLAEAVLCAADPAAALHEAYAGNRPKSRPGCMAEGLDANEAFAKANGFSGTPVMVRASDGAVLQGYRSASEIRRFMKLAPNKGGTGQ